MSKQHTNPAYHRDENVRPGTTAEKLAELPAAFAAWGAKGGDQGWDAQLCRQYGLAAIDHVHHAGNSPALADGAAVVLVGSARALERAGLRPRARIAGMADVGSDRTLALTGTVTAAQLAITYVPALQPVFATESVPFWDGLLVIAIGVALFAIVETEKQLRLHLLAINAHDPRPIKAKG